MHNEGVKKKDQEPVTRGMLREELASLRGEMGAQGQSLKDEIGGLKTEFRGFRDEITSVIKGFAAEVLRMQARTEKRIDDLEDTVRSFRSELIGRMDGFMAQTLAVRTDQTILVHRVDNLEGRVGALERKTSP